MFRECKHGVSFDEGHFRCDDCIFETSDSHLTKESRDACDELLREDNSKLDTIQGKKFDDGKSRVDFIPWEALDEMGKVFAFGATKYNEGFDANWSRGIPWHKLIGSTFRHLGKFMAGIDRDEESGCLHLAHVMVNAAMIIWFMTHRKDLDTRWVKLVPKQEK